MIKVNGLLHTPAAIPTWKEPWYPIGDWMGPAAELDVWEKTFFSLPGFEPQIVQARSHYITFVIPAPRKYWVTEVTCHSKFKKRKAKYE